MALNDCPSPTSGPGLQPSRPVASQEPQHTQSLLRGLQPLSPSLQLSSKPSVSFSVPGLTGKTRPPGKSWAFPGRRTV